MSERRTNPRPVKPEPYPTAKAECVKDEIVLMEDRQLSINLRNFFGTFELTGQTDLNEIAKGYQHLFLAALSLIKRPEHGIAEARKCLDGFMRAKLAHAEIEFPAELEAKIEERLNEIVKTLGQAESMDHLRQMLDKLGRGGQ